MNTPHKRKASDLWMFREILERPGVLKILGDQCTFGIVVHRRERTSPGPHVNRMDDKFIKDSQKH